MGRAQNLLGISCLHHNSKMKLALKHFTDSFKTYTKSNNFLRIVESEVNLGIIQNMLGNFSKSEKHWGKALQLNQSIGNVVQEANVLMNSGVFNYEHANYKKAIQLYERAGNLNKGLGNKMHFGLVNNNLGEVYIEICEYQKAFEVLQIAEKTFSELENKDELIEVYFSYARLFITVKNSTKTNEYLKKIELLKSENTDREKLFIKYIQTLEDFYFGNSIEFKSLQNLMDRLYESNEVLIASEVLLIAAEKLIENENYNEAITLLNSKEMSEIISFNEKYKAFKFYLFSKIPIHLQAESNFTKNFLLLKALAIQQKGAISELTINILNDLVVFFYERGNDSKAKEYALIGNIIIQYILQSTSNTTLKGHLEGDKYSKISQKFNALLGKNKK